MSTVVTNERAKSRGTRTLAFQETHTKPEITVKLCHVSSKCDKFVRMDVIERHRHTLHQEYKTEMYIKPTTIKLSAKF